MTTEFASPGANPQPSDFPGLPARSVAHDFNNIITVILAYTELAGMDADKPDVTRKHLAEIRRAGEHAKNLARQTLSAGPRQTPEHRPARLQLVTEEALKWVRLTMPDHVEMEARIDASTPLVLANPAQILQVVMNLCLHAQHAMCTRYGRLTVVLEACDVSEVQAHAWPGLRPGRQVRLTVADTGHGMEADTVKHIFEPACTTESPGAGTGLSLPVVQGMVKDHAGVITVQSQPGVGTTFTIYFPIHQSVATEEPPRRFHHGPSPGVERPARAANPGEQPFHL